MKKILSALLLILALASCQKEVMYQEVVFSINGIVGSMPTKATYSGINEALGTIVPPTNIQLTLRSKTVSSRVVTVTVGTAQAVPVDTYVVTGQYAPETGYEAIYKGRLYQVPTYDINTEVTIVANQSSYSLTATYTCLALVFDLDATSSVEILKAGDGTYEDYTDKLVVAGAFRVGYIYTWTNWTPLRIRVYPVDLANYEMTSYTINVEQTEYSQWCGKYYYYPVNHVATESGSLGIAFPQWLNGRE